MNKIKIEVPDYVKYISDWKNYSIPYGKCIIDKGITGCGFTEFCLMNSDNIILCSPRKLLLQNKIDQHPLDNNILYLKNSLDNTIEFDGDEYEKQLKKRFSKKKSTVNENYELIKEQFKNQIFQHSLFCKLSKKPIKFLITYDSLKYLIGFLGSEISNYKIVIDEFQSIFLDSNFKPEVELDFLEYLCVCPNVCYLSATPMLDKYLDQLSEFKDLDMYEFYWTNYVEKAHINKKLVSSSYDSIKKVIEQFKSGIFPQIIEENKIIHESHEAVIYINSVTDIIRLVNACGLTPQNTDIICADVEKNRKKLKKLGFLISKPNTYENRYLNKMFTFCTRTVYLGADFYSDNASSWVVCNPNRKHLAIDISLDLPQIIGRQRMVENPWRNRCVMFYQTIKELVTEEDNIKEIERKQLNSDAIFNVYNKLIDNFEKENIARKIKQAATYSDDYVGISKKTGEPLLNYLVLISERRAWEVVQQDYLDEINIRAAFNKAKFDVENYQFSVDIQTPASIILGPGNFESKMKVYCDFRERYNLYREIIDAFHFAIRGYDDYSNFYNYLGPKVIKANSYIRANLEREKNNLLKSGDLKKEILTHFFIGKKYSLKDIKEKLGEIYKKCDITSTPKAQDLVKYFNLRNSKITINGKQVHGFQIISLK